MKLRYKESAGRREPEQAHLGIKAIDLKLLTCKEFYVKVGNATKVELVGRLLSPCQMGLFANAEVSELASCNPRSKAAAG